MDYPVQKRARIYFSKSITHFSCLISTADTELCGLNAKQAF